MVKVTADGEFEVVGEDGDDNQLLVEEAKNTEDPPLVPDAPEPPKAPAKPEQ